MEKTTTEEKLNDITKELLKDKTTKEKVEYAIGGLNKAYTYEIDGEWIMLYSSDITKYNSSISAVPIEAMIEVGFHLLRVTTKQNGQPMVIFTTYKV